MARFTHSMGELLELAIVGELALDFVDAFWGDVLGVAFAEVGVTELAVLPAPASGLHG